MVHHLQSAALDLERYEELLRRFEREYQEIQGHGEDLLHHQQELQIHGQALLRLHEDSRRHALSVRRLYEDNQNHASRLRSMEGMVRALFNDNLKLIRDTLISSGSTSSERERIEQAVEEKTCKSSETAETEDDLLIKVDDNGVDSYAAKTLIDLAGQEENQERRNNLNPSSSQSNQSSQVVLSRNVGGGVGEVSREMAIARVEEMLKSGNVGGGVGEVSREMAIARVEGMLKGKEMMKYADKKKEKSRVNLDLGCRFNPTDQELIACLERKVAGESTPSYIREKNLYGTEEPEDMFRSNSDGEMYFFTSIKKKYDQGRKIDRMVGKGTWKIQSTKNVYDDPQNKTRLIGFKRTLNFVEDLGSLERKGKNSWIMHEYILNAAIAVNEEQGRWAICRIKRGRNNRIGLPPTSFSPITMSLKRPGEDNAAYESLMPDTKIAKTSNVLMLKSATASILPEPKAIVPAPAPVSVSAPVPVPLATANANVKSATSILPEPKATVPVSVPVATANANVEAPQHSRGQDQCVLSSQYQPTPDNIDQPWIKFL